jgi:hypothetical protein
MTIFQEYSQMERWLNSFLKLKSRGVSSVSRLRRLHTVPIKINNNNKRNNYVLYTTTKMIIIASVSNFGYTCNIFYHLVHNKYIILFLFLNSSTTTTIQYPPLLLLDLMYLPTQSIRWQLSRHSPY